jgi:hypothetical protein
VPAERIAQNLAFINWTVLVGLAIGSFGAVALTRLRTDVTRGFAAFTAVCAVAFGLLALASDTGLPASLVGSPVQADPAWDGPRRVALGAFCLAGGAYAVALARHRRSPLLAAAGLTAGGATLVAGALGWSDGIADAVPLLLQLVVLAAGIGGAFAAMILGHWYLVTSRLSERPLVLLARILTGIVAAQLTLFAVWLATGAGPGGAAPFAILGGEWALFVWLRLLIGLVFPLVVSWAAIQTARTRSMESATGLLYIDVGAIAAGTILAAGLYFGAGLLV